MVRKWLLLLFALLVVIPLRAAEPVETPVVIRFDAGPRTAGTTAFSGGYQVAPTLAPLMRWARLENGGDGLSPLWPDVTPAKPVWALATTDGAGRVGLGITGDGHAAYRLRIETRLPRGIWIVEAALVDGAIGPDDAFAATLPGSPRLWRMESLFQRDEGATTKVLTLKPGQALFLRWTEAGASLGAARRAVREALWTTGNSIMQNQIGGALRGVDDLRDALPILTERGDRDKIAKRVHTALLATAKAQALWQNWREASPLEQDRDFDNLTGALSEISCAAYNLVPNQTRIPGANGGPPGVRVALTNAGKRTIPLVALGLRRKDGTTTGSDLTVFRSLAPGASVGANFVVAPSDAGEPQGIVQFISGMGAAIVRACPDYP